MTTDLNNLLELANAELERQNDELRTDAERLKVWEENARYLLDGYPKSVRSRYKGLEENLMESMCITFIALRDAALAADQKGK